jgi:hypothetical protein
MWKRLKIYDVGNYYAFFTLQGLSVTSGASFSVPGPYVIEEDETEMAGLHQIQNLPGYAGDDELLEGIALQVTPSGVLLGFPSGWWITISERRQSISLLTQEGQMKESKVVAKKGKKAKIDSDKCLFIVGAEKKEISWDRNVLAYSNSVLKNFCLELVRSSIPTRSS